MQDVSEIDGRGHWSRQRKKRQIYPGLLQPLILVFDLPDSFSELKYMSKLNMSEYEIYARKSLTILDKRS